MNEVFIRTGKSKVAKRLLLVCGSLTLALVALEICLSMVSFLFYPRLSVPDLALGAKYRPTAGTVRRRELGGYVNEVAINSEGFRDDEFPARDHGYRIMLLGDSMTFGLEADQHEIYPTLVERLLRKHFARSDIDVMNFAIPGFSTAQELASLRQYEPKYDPHAVVLQMNDFNDFEENSWIFRGRYRPHFLLRDGKLIEGPPPTRSYRFLGWLRDQSTLFFLLTNFTEVLTVSQPLTRREQIALTMHILEEIRRYVQERGLPLYIIYMRDPDDPNDGYAAVKEFVEGRNIPFRLIPLVAEEQVNGMGHWNANGHRHAAETVAGMLTVQRNKTSELRDEK